MPVNGVQSVKQGCCSLQENCLVREKETHKGSLILVESNMNLWKWKMTPVMQVMSGTAMITSVMQVYTGFAYLASLYSEVYLNKSSF